MTIRDISKVFCKDCEWYTGVKMCFYRRSNVDPDVKIDPITGEDIITLQPLEFCVEKNHNLCCPDFKEKETNVGPRCLQCGGPISGCGDCGTGTC